MRRVALLAGLFGWALVVVLVVAVVDIARADRPAVDSPERARVPATIVVHRRHAELVRHVLLRDPRNRVAALRVCKLGHTDAKHCTLVPVADVRYGVPDA